MSVHYSCVLNPCKSNKFYDVDKCGDIMYINAICFEDESDIYEVQSLKIEIGGNIIWKIPYDVLKSSGIKKMDDKYFLAINDNLFGKGHVSEIKGLDSLSRNGFIVMALLKYSSVRILLKCKTDINFDMYFNYVYDRSIFPDTDTQIKLMKQKHHTMCNNYLEIPIATGYTHFEDKHIVTSLYVKIYDSIADITVDVDGKDMFRAKSYNIHRYLVCSQQRWTSSHTIALKLSLSHIFPNDIIDVIKSHIDKQQEYIYHFPVAHALRDSDDISIYIDTSNGEYDGIIYVVRKNMFTYAGGTGILKWT